MRVLYNTCVADPWVKVAEKLQREYGYEPVYWIGYNYDDSEHIVKDVFPSICYQSYPDAWKGIFSKEIREKASECYIDIDFLNNISRYELQAIKMMDRLDYDRYSFNYMERERHFLNLLKNWMACIEIYKPDLVVSAVNPHRVYDYVLYLLCKQMNIKFICFQYSMCVERIYATDNCYSIGDIFDKDYHYYLSKGNLSKDDLPVEVRKQYEKVLKDYSEAAPAYMKTHVISNKRNANILYLLREFVKKIDLKSVFIHGISVTMIKNRRYSLECTHWGIWNIVKARMQKHRYLKYLNRYYLSLAEAPSDGDKYVYFPLHYQPEATTSPTGDIFVNQRLCVEVLLQNLPNDYFVYVKEHPQQFMLHMLGHTSRIKCFYDDLKATKRVKLIPLNIDSYSLMRNAKAVATVTGTIGWEAIMHRLPVIVFGMIWYEKAPGVLRVGGDKSAESICTFIEEYEYNEQAILSYLLAFTQKSILAYHYKGRKEKMNLSENVCVDNILKEVVTQSQQCVKY